MKREYISTSQNIIDVFKIRSKAVNSGFFMYANRKMMQISKVIVILQKRYGRQVKINITNG